jgi:hypothetical protein
MKRTWIIVIVVAVVAVAAYLWWKMKASATPTTPANPLDNSAYGLPLTGKEETQLSNWIASINYNIKNKKNGWSEAGIREGMTQTGATYENQIIIAALFQMYKTANVITEARYNELYQLMVKKS